MREKEGVLFQLVVTIVVEVFYSIKGLLRKNSLIIVCNVSFQQLV